MNRRNTYLLVCGFLLIFSVARSYAYPFKVEVNENDVNWDELAKTVNMTVVRQHMEFFTGLGTRAIGYSGNEVAARYIFEKFVEYNLTDVKYEEFEVAEAISYGANVTVLSTGELINLHPILPNGPCPSTTPPEGITGPVVYGGQGYIKNFDGSSVPINGSIVLMDWDTRNRWINAVRLGAKAVIFLTPPNVEHVMSLEGWLDVKYMEDVPLNFPRFFINDAGADILLKHRGDNVRLVSTVRWERVHAKNVMGIVKGTEYPDIYIFLSSYFDSCSIAPTAAPGAQESSGISALLELTRYLSQHPPRMSILFIAFNGHHQSLAGARFFAKDYFSPTYKDVAKWQTLGSKIIWGMNLDFSTGTNFTHLTDSGGEYTHYWHYMWPDFLSTGNYFDSLYMKILESKPLGKTYSFELSLYLSSDLSSEIPYAWQHSWKLVFPYDHEPIVTATLFSITLTQLYDSRPYYYTPFDTFDRVNFNNLQAHIELAHMFLLYSLNDDSDQLLTILQKVYPNNYGSGPHGQALVKGTVAFYDIETGFYKPVPNALVHIAASPHLELGHQVRDYESRVRSSYGPVNLFANEKGDFEYWPANDIDPEICFTAWVINETTGNVMYAPDYGINKYSKPMPVSGSSTLYNMGFLTVFKTGMMVLFDTASPEALDLPILTGQVGQLLYPEVTINDFKLHTKVSEYYSWPFNWEIPFVIIGVPPDTSIEILWKFAGQRYPLATLFNASDIIPDGSGYTLKVGEQKILPMTSIEYAENLYQLNSKRFNIFSTMEPQIFESKLYSDHLKTKSLIEKTYQNLSKNEYSKAFFSSYEAWVTAKDVYFALRPKIEDAIFTVPVLSAFILPFVFTAEKIFFGAKGFKKLIAYIGLFATIVFLFYFMHPGFKLTTSPEVIIVGFMMGTLCVPLLVILFNYIGSYITILRVEHLGRHEAAISKFSETVQSFSTGIENIKRYRLRATLGLVSIILVISALVNISSMEAITLIKPQPSPMGFAGYDGIYVHINMWGQGMDGMSQEIVGLLEVKYGDNVDLVTRSHMYPGITTYYNVPQRQGYDLIYNGKKIVAPILWGLTPKDGYVSNFLSGGTWFLPNDSYAIILNENQANSLGITTDDLPVPVNFLQMSFHVVGIVSMELENIRELDGEVLTPIKKNLPPQLQAQWNKHVTLDEVFILPYEKVINLGGELYSISIMPKDPTLTPNIGEEIFEMIPSANYLIFSSYEDQVQVYSQQYQVSFFGIQYQIIPIIISILTMFNYILTSVYERKNLISIYACIGLSPLHIAIMFFAETIVYALIGGVVGYLTAIAMGKMLVIFIPLPSLNYSSSWVIISLLTSMIVLIASSIYPILLAARFVTPSLERVWTIQTKPKEDWWEIPLPFYPSSKEEIHGILTYLQEYMLAHTVSDSPGFYVSSRCDIIDEKLEDERMRKVLLANVSLFPYESGVSQEVRLNIVQVEPERWQVIFRIHRTSGRFDDWVRLNHKFLNSFRGQLLIWRSLGAEEKERYEKMRNHLYD